MDQLNALKNRASTSLSEKTKEDSKARKKSFSKLLFFVNKIKFQIQSRLFWGRSSLYKNITHFLMIFIATAFLATGISNRITSSNVTNTIFQREILGTGTLDALYQGGSLELTSRNQIGITGLRIFKHIVQSGENLQTIADKYTITSDTIRWANKDKLDFTSFLTDNVAIGLELSIPEINGVLYTVKPGETIDDIIRVTSLNNDEANRFNIEQFNNLQPPYNLTAGQNLFIPDGNLKTASVGLYNIASGIFINPLSHPDCAGYSFSRGFLYYHNGVDLARWPGCPISAVANGTVIFAGQSNFGEGWNVRIDHGGGIVTHYYHGNGEFYVKTGDRVKQGQPIMFMGTSGNSTGVHLHFSLFYNGIAIDPAPYVPY